MKLQYVLLLILVGVVVFSAGCTSDSSDKSSSDSNKASTPKIPSKYTVEIKARKFTKKDGMYYYHYETTGKWRIVSVKPNISMSNFEVKYGVRPIQIGKNVQMFPKTEIDIYIPPHEFMDVEKAGKLVIVLESTN